MINQLPTHNRSDNEGNADEEEDIDDNDRDNNINNSIIDKAISTN